MSLPAGARRAQRVTTAGAVAGAVGQRGTGDKMLVIGLVFVIIGVALKFSAEPFQMWVADAQRRGADPPLVLLPGNAPGALSG